MNRKYNFNDESSMSPQAKAAMYGIHGCFSLRTHR